MRVAFALHKPVYSITARRGTVESDFNTCGWYAARLFMNLDI